MRKQTSQTFKQFPKIKSQITTEDTQRWTLNATSSVEGQWWVKLGPALRFLKDSLVAVNVRCTCFTAICATSSSVNRYQSPQTRLLSPVKTHTMTRSSQRDDHQDVVKKPQLQSGHQLQEILDADGTGSVSDVSPTLHAQLECFTLFTGPVSPNAAFVPSEAKTQRIFLRLFQSFHLLLCTHKLLLYLCLFTLQRSFQYLYNNLRCLKPSLDTVKSNWAAELVPLPLKIAGCSQ